MCRWGYCTALDSVFMCKFCGTRYCNVCLRGDYAGVQYYPDLCRVCRQSYCRGKQVEKSQTDQRSANKSFIATADAIKELDRQKLFAYP